MVNKPKGIIDLHKRSKNFKDWQKIITEDGKIVSRITGNERGKILNKEGFKETLFNSYLTSQEIEIIPDYDEALQLASNSFAQSTRYNPALMTPYVRKFLMGNTKKNNNKMKEGKSKSKRKRSKTRRNKK